MNEDHGVNAPASPSQVMRQFVECVNNGAVRRELAEDCILHMFAHCTKGADAVTGCIRTQILGRYNHMGFQQAECCEATQQMYLHDRFVRSFEMLRRRLKAQKQRHSPPAGCRLRAESTEDINAAVDDMDAAINCPNANLLMTPPRATSSATVHSPELALLQYIESFGVLESCHQPNDGGIDFNSNQVRLTLGYRYINGSLACKGESAAVVCLIVYEELPIRSSAIRQPQQPHRIRSFNFRSVHTDDESEELAPRSVRRALFASASEEPEESVDSTPFNDSQVISILSPTLAPRKRQHKKETKKSVKAKRPTVLGGMRL